MFSNATCVHVDYATFLPHDDTDTGVPGKVPLE